MAKTWNVTLEGKEKGAQDDIELIFFDSAEIIGKGFLNKRFVSDLLYHIGKNPHYEAVKNVKQVKSSSGDDLSSSDVGIILATSADGDLEVGFLFKKAKKGGFNIIALWPDDFAHTCKEKPNIYKAFLVRLIQDPAFFKHVSMVLP